MGARYATIITNPEGNNEVISIAWFAEDNALAPEIRKPHDESGAYTERVSDDVKIGMIRGGPVNPSGDFGWPEGTPQWNW